MDFPGKVAASSVSGNPLEIPRLRIVAVFPLTYALQKATSALRQVV
jgi:hypothetical protein